jgi:hypothetical protein
VWRRLPNMDWANQIIGVGRSTRGGPQTLTLDVCLTISQHNKQCLTNHHKRCSV